MKIETTSRDRLGGILVAVTFVLFASCAIALLGQNESAWVEMDVVLRQRIVRSATPLLTPFVAAMSLVAVLYSQWLDRRAKRADVFRMLRSDFSELRKRLPGDWQSRDQLPVVKEEYEAMVSYWQFAFTEWFITTRLSWRLFGYLWRNYYEDAIGVTCKSPAMIAALFDAARLVGPYADRAFLDVVRELTSDDVVREARRIKRSDVAVPPPFSSTLPEEIGDCPSGG